MLSRNKLPPNAMNTDREKYENNCAQKSFRPRLHHTDAVTSPGGGVTTIEMMKFPNIFVGEILGKRTHFP